MKKIASLAALALALTLSLTGCSGTGSSSSNADSTDEAAAVTLSSLGSITVNTREDGSGTRGAFTELFEIEDIIETAEVTNSTSVMITSVQGNKSAIGYVSLGSLSDDVKALKIDGNVASTDNVKNGSYKISRPFNIATKGDVSEAAQDFIDYILSAEGQAVVEENGYVSTGNTGAYSGSKPSGKVTVAGSSSVTPVMEKLKEAYAVVNPNAEVVVQQSDSTIGITSVIDGICDIGMASRELKDSETEQGVTSTVIAMDGIAVIVNKENPIDDIASENVTKIYTGEITDWSELE